MLDNTTCKICGDKVKKIFNRVVLNRYDVDYYQCNNCKFIQTIKPFWLEEAYKNPINIDDTGLVARNNLFAKRTSVLILFLFDKSRQFVDYAGGYGLFVRLMRDYGFDFYWFDPFTENIFAKGFEYDAAKQTKIEAVTAFECFEHFEDPLSEIEKMLSISDNIFFSTEIFKDDFPNPDNWNYYSFSHGQHIAFYSYASLETIAKKFDLNLFSNGKSFHLFTKKKLNNLFFKSLLYFSLAGGAAIIKPFLNSKLHSDSLLLKVSKKV